MKHTYFFRRILSAFMLLMLSTFSSYARFEVDGIYYEEINLITVSVTSGPTATGGDYSGDVVIPASVSYNDRTYKVTSINGYAFRFSPNLTSVTIPESVTSIGNNAFYGCTGLISVTIPESVTSIGSNVFTGCSSLLSVTIPDGVTRIDNATFKECTSLTSITIPESVTSIGYHAFEGCTGLKSVNIPESVESIEEGAFFGCSSLTSITIPEGVKSIEKNTFEGCTNLTSVIIGNGVTEIGISAFRDCTNLMSVIIGNGVTEIGISAFQNCTNLMSVIIGNGVKSVSSIAFQGCESLTKVTINSDALVNHDYTESSTGIKGMFGSQVEEYIIGDDVTRIGTYAFYNNDKLKSVTIGNGVTEIASYAFNGCTDLTSITIPESVTGIGEYAFSGCTDLASAIFSDGVNTSIGAYAFYNCSSLPSVTIPESMENIEEHAFDGCTNLMSVIIGNGVTGIASYVFNGCTNLMSVIIGNGVTEIGSSAFQGCSSLTSIIIPDNVMSIGAYAFYGCDLASITIGNGVESIGEYAFYNCSITSLTIPDNVKSIGAYAFYGCTDLASITIGNGVESIEEYAFYDCRSLTSLTIPDNVKSIGAHAFYGCTDLASITIGNGVENIEEYAFYDCRSLPSITIPENVKGIGAYAFYVPSSPQYKFHQTVTINSDAVVSKTYTESSNITDIFGDVEEYIIGDAVTEIGAYAFSDSNGHNYPIPSVIIGSGVKSIDTKAFNYAKKVTINSDAIVNKTYTESSNITNLFGKVEEYIIGDAVTGIGAYAFYSLRYSTDYYLPLQSVTIGNGVTSIGNYAFYYYAGIQSLTIGNSVKSIGDFAFYYYTGTQPVTCMANEAPQMGRDVFQSSSIEDATLNVTLSAYDAYRKASTWSRFGTIVIIDRETTVSVGEEGLATYSPIFGLSDDLDYYIDFTNVEDIAAYRATKENNIVTLTRAYKVDKNEGVLLRSLTGEAVEVENVPVILKKSDETAQNDFIGVKTATRVYGNVNGATDFVLSSVDGVVGFFKAKPYSSNGTFIEAGKAYLSVRGYSANAKGLQLVFNDDTVTGIGIADVQEETETDGAYYTLNGIRVDNPTQKGIYIKGGKKYIIK